MDRPPLRTQTGQEGPGNAARAKELAIELRDDRRRPGSSGDVGGVGQKTKSHTAPGAA